MNEVQVRPFRGSVRALSRLIKRPHNSEKISLYHLDPPQLRWLLKSPQLDRRWTLGCYRGKELIGFNLTLKKYIRLPNGRRESVSFNTLAFTKKGSQRWLPHLRMAEYTASSKAHNAGMMTFGFVDGRSLNNQILKTYCGHRYPYFQKIRSFHAYIKRVDILRNHSDSQAINSDLTIRHHISPRDFAPCARLMNRAPVKAFSEFWTAKTLGYYLRGRYRITCLAEKRGHIIGFLNGFRLRVPTTRGLVPTLLVSQYCFHGLSDKERAGLIRAMIQRAGKEGVRQIITSDTGHVPVKNWLDSGFMRSFSSINAYAVSRECREKFKVPASFCMEVL